MSSAESVWLARMGVEGCCGYGNHETAWLVLSRGCSPLLGYSICRVTGTLALCCGMALHGAAFAADAAVAGAGRVLQVGLAFAYKTPSAAARAARDGDTVEIEAGEYPSDVAIWPARRLTIRGVHGLAHLEAAGASAQGKAIWVIQGNDTTVEHVEFSGCHVPDRNGAGIRQEGSGLTLRDCRFHDNEDGLLTGANPLSDIVIESCEFYHNGAGDGKSHNIYVGRVRSLTMRFCSSHHANKGHLIKSRAEANFIYYNRLMDEEDGQSSYVIDLPNGGRSVVLGNIIQHGPKAENGVAVTYAEEGAANLAQELYVVNNTYVNERANGGVFVRTPAGAASPARVINNLIVGAAKVLNGPGEVLNNVLTSAPGFVDARHYDYRLTAASPAIHAGTNTGTAGEIKLTPEWEYRSPLGKEPRPRAAGAPDCGAYAFAAH